MTSASDVNSKPARHRRRLIRILTFVIIGVVLLAAYALSVRAYSASIRESFTAPPTTPNGVAVVMVPMDVDAIGQTISTQMLIFPGRNLVTPEGRLLRDISLDTYATESGTITFDAGTVPAPIRASIPALGVVQKYPFDNYEYELQIRSVVEPKVGQTINPEPIPMSLSVQFSVPGWSYTPKELPEGFSTQTVTSRGVVSRAGGTITIAMIFILLIVMFGVLSVLIVFAGWRGRPPLTVSTAGWLTSSVFALIALRNALPGHPPLGSWMDVLAYFWVIAVIMLMIGVTVVTIVTAKPGQT